MSAFQVGQLQTSDEYATIKGKSSHTEIDADEVQVPQGQISSLMMHNLLLVTGVLGLCIMHPCISQWFRCKSYKSCNWSVLSVNFPVQFVFSTSRISLASKNNLLAQTASEDKGLVDQDDRKR
jgi:hypothetical protein